MNQTQLPVFEPAESLLTFAALPGGVVVTGCRREVTCVVVPERVNGAPVICIGSQAFLNPPHLLSVTLPDTVRTINEAAFMGCTALMHITAGSGLEKVLPHAFCGCVSLQQADFPSTPLAALNAFAGCYQLEAAREPVRYR